MNNAGCLQSADGEIYRLSYTRPTFTYY